MRTDYVSVFMTSISLYVWGEENESQIAVCIIQDSWVACDRNSIQINLPKGKYIGLCNLPDRSGGEDFTRINPSLLTVCIWGIHGASAVLEGM